MNIKNNIEISEISIYNNNETLIAKLILSLGSYKIELIETFLGSDEVRIIADAIDYAEEFLKGK